MACDNQKRGRPTRVTAQTTPFEIVQHIGEDGEALSITANEPTGDGTAQWLVDVKARFVDGVRVLQSFRVEPHKLHGQRSRLVALACAPGALAWIVGVRWLTGDKNPIRIGLRAGPAIGLSAPVVANPLFASTLRPIVTPGDVVVGVAPVSLAPAATRLRKSIVLQSSFANNPPPDVIRIGGPNVALIGAAAPAGIELTAGDSIEIDTDDASNLFAIASVAGQRLLILAQ